MLLIASLDGHDEHVVGPGVLHVGKVEAIHVVPQDPVCVVPLLESEEVHAGRGAVRMFSRRLTRQANVEDDGGYASPTSPP